MRTYGVRIKLPRWVRDVLDVALLMACIGFTTGGIQELEAVLRRVCLVEIVTVLGRV
mgnify:CR=1 FL=1